MRILIAHSYYRLPGGEDRYVDQLVALLRENHDVELLGRHNEEIGSRTGALQKLFFSPRERERVAQTITGFAPDVIHINNTYPSLGPAVHLAAADVPLVMTVHNHRLRCPNGYMFTEGAVCSRCSGGAYHNAVLHDCFASRTQAAAYAGALWVHRFPLRLENKVTLFIGVSDFMRQRIVSWGIPPERTIAVRNFTDHVPRSRPPPPGEFGAYVGRISAEKGVAVLLEALRKAGDPPFRVVGDGPLLDEMRSLAGRLRLVNTLFLGRLSPERVGELLAESRFVAVPSLWDETSCLSGVEGLAAGRPLLVSRIGALEELVQNGEGLSFESGNAGDMAERMRMLLEDDELCRRAGHKGLELVEREFTPSVHAARLEAAYQQAIRLKREGSISPKG